MIINNLKIIKESDKAYQFELKGFGFWVPKSITKLIQTSIEIVPLYGDFELKFTDINNNKNKFSVSVSLVRNELVLLSIIDQLKG